MMNDISSCTLCPRECGIDRTAGPGYCGADSRIRICRAALHMWEEPCISGERGSGTVFFSGCPLHCVFCQNHKISCGGVGEAVSEEELKEVFFNLAEQGAHNINLVSPTQYADVLLRTLSEVKKRLDIPVVYNTGGYERLQTLRALKGAVDVYLPDIKYYDSALSERLCGAKDYFERAMLALEEMVDRCGSPVLERGIMTRGVMVRHLVLPGKRKDSLKVIEELSRRFAPGEIFISLMSQYTPMPGVPADIDRRVTTFEYESVADAVRTAGFDGYFQGREAAQEAYIPPFSL